MKKKALHNKLRILLFLALTINSILPLDKLFIPVYIIERFINGIRLTHKQIITLLSISVCAITSFLINIPNSNIEIFYPIIFLAGAFLFAKSNIDLLVLKNIFFINVIFGLVCALLADVGIYNPYSRTLLEKGMPFLYAPLGFSPTNQVFGTFCILFLIISFEYKKFGYAFYVTIIALIMSLNRCSILFMLILLFVYKRKIFYGIMLIGLCLFIKYWNQINILLSTATIESRNQLRQGVEHSFWRSIDSFVLLFGLGNSNTTTKIAANTLHERTYIENGLDFLLHSYGYVGFVVIVIITILFFIYLCKIKEWKFLMFFIYYLLIEQWLTQEFLASSFMFFMGINIFLMKNKLNKNQ